MKKCIVCLVLICLILVGCQSGYGRVKDAPGSKTTTTPSVAATNPLTTIDPAPQVTTIPTIWNPRTTTGIPPCAIYNEHVYKNGYCIYCGNRNRNWQACTGEHTYQNGHCIYCQMTEPGFEFCTAGHTYKLGYCIYCAAKDPDFPPCKDGHTFENGFCVICPAVDSNYDFCAEGHIYQYGWCIYCGIIDENYSPCQAGHTFNDGCCIYCLARDPNYDPCAGGHVYQNGWCIYCLNQQPAIIPTTVSTTRPSTCGLPLCYGKGHTYENGKCKYCGNPEPNPNLSTTRPSTPSNSETTRPSSWICGTPFLTTTKPMRAIGYVEKKADLTGVELISGDQTVIPIGKMRTANTYDESADRWLCALGSGVKFGNMAEEDIPVLTHVTAIRIGIPENAEFVGIFIQSERTEQGELSSLFQMAELEPGTYYVKIGLNRYGDTHEGRQEIFYYEYGFKLIKTIA